MKSPEINTPRHPSALRRAILPIALGVSTIASTGGLHHTDRIFEPISNPDQPAFTYYYGHLPLSHPGTMMETGNIADNFRPMSGWGAEYTEADIQEFYRSADEIRRAGFDGIIISWHDIGDVRDKGSNVIINQALPRCDSTFPGMEVKFIVERLANLNEDNSDEKLDMIMEHMWENYFNNPHYFRNEKGLPEVDFFTTDNPELWDNVKISEKLHRLKEKWGINPVMRSAFGGNITLDGRNKYTSELDTFTYGFQPLDLWPGGLEITPHQATVTGEYSKTERGETVRERDFKHRVFSEDDTRQDIRVARSSDSETAAYVSYNEGPEKTGFEGDAVKIAILGQEFYDPGDRELHLSFPAPCIESEKLEQITGQSSTGEKVIVSFPTPSPIPLKEAA